MKASTKAKKLQTKLAIDILTGTIPKEAMSAYWSWDAKIWHLKGESEGLPKHCDTCRCSGYGQLQTMSLCKTTQWPEYATKWGSGTPADDSRPCKRCLQALNKIAKSGE